VGEILGASVRAVDPEPTTQTHRTPRVVSFSTQRCKTASLRGKYPRRFWNFPGFGEKIDALQIPEIPAGANDSTREWQRI
jgi:hypothetical protein